MLPAKIHTTPPTGTTIMRLIPLLLLTCLCTGAYAADAPPPPPLPPAGAEDAVDEPQVTITHQDGQKVEEYRVGGKLFMIKVTPAKGPAYYLVDDVGDGSFTRRDSLDGGIRPPRWVLFRF
jgi:hypothetical protein